MKLFFITMLLITLILTCVLIIITRYNKIKTIDNKINLAQKKIEELLLIKYTKMVDCYKHIKKYVKKKDLLKDFNDLNIESLNSYDLDDNLNGFYDVMFALKDSYKSLNTKEYKALLTGINDVTENIIANERFFNKYNDILIKELNGINKLIAKFGKIKVKTSYELKEPAED